MAMLAEPRRKQKYSVNPRGTDWSKDDNKFGQKLLEKMGWNKGKGLGANEDGRIDHVGIKFKADNKGVGCSNKYVDNWIEHQDDFNDLLQCLNQNHDTSTGNQDDEPDQQSVASLENKSKKSRSRVHYMKFTKGKDLSSRSKEDLACIFGERKHKKQDRKTIEEEVIQELVQEVTVTENEEIENNHGVQTFTNSCSIQEYFALKMKQRKQTLLQKSDPSPPSSELTIKTDDEAKSDDDIDTHNNSFRNKKKRVSFNLDYQCFEDNTYTNIREKSLKSKKKKKRHNLEDDSENSETETKKSNKKSKKKKKVTEVETEIDEEVDVGVYAVDVQSDDLVQTKKKKKKSKKRVREVEEEIENEDSVPKRKKKKLKKKVVEEVQEGKKKLLKKKKVQEEEIEEVQESKKKLLKKKKKSLRKKEANCNGSVDVLKQKPVRTEYHAIDQHKWKCSESLTSDQVKTICTSFKGADIHKIVGYLNSGPVATDYYS